MISNYIRDHNIAVRAGKSRYGTAGLLIALAVMLCGCSTEDTPPRDSHAQSVLVRLLVPSQGTPTRTMDAAGVQENQVDDIIVLGFDKDGKLLFQSEGQDITTGLTENIKTFTVEIRIDDEQYRRQGYKDLDLLFLANCGDIITAKYPPTGEIPSGTTYAAVRQALTLSVTEGTGWITDAIDTDYRAIPMVSKYIDPDDQTVGPTVPLTIHPKLTDINDIELERAIARVDIDATAVKDYFEITEAYIYRYNTGGWIFPGLYKTAVPTPAQVDKKLLYTTTDGIKMEREIYLLEVRNSLSTLERDERVALVIGGIYKPEGNSTSWYRVDFKKQKTDTNYIDITRNGLYTVKITSVGESGWPDPDVAYYGIYKDIMVEIISWEEIEFPNTPL